MRLGVFALCAALFLAIVAGQNSLLRSTEAETTNNSAITACAQTAAQGGHCWQAPLGSTPGLVLSHTVLAGGCAHADLHVMKYVPSSQPAGAPLVATWCT